MKVSINRSKCRGVRNCASIAPDVFDIDEEFKAVVLDPKGDNRSEERRVGKECRL